jgi:type IV secretory pathway VirB10-like protein
MNACARVVALAVAWCFSLSALAQEKPAKRDDLDVTMQIIVDPNAKLPDEVVRRIPLPASRAQVDRSTGPSEPKPDVAEKGRERAEEARELGREASERAKERAREAQEQREEARNSNADRGKDNGKGKDDADRPNRPDHPNPPDRPNQPDRPNPPDHPNPPGPPPRP